MLLRWIGRDPHCSLEQKEKQLINRSAAFLFFQTIMGIPVNSPQKHAISPAYLSDYLPCSLRDNA